MTTQPAKFTARHWRCNCKDGSNIRHITITKCGGCDCEIQDGGAVTVKEAKAAGYVNVIPVSVAPLKVK